MKGCWVNRVAVGRNEVFVQVPEPIHVGSQEKGGVWKDFSTLSLCLCLCVLCFCMCACMLEVRKGTKCK